MSFLGLYNILCFQNFHKILVLLQLWLINPQNVLKINLLATKPKNIFDKNDASSNGFSSLDESRVLLTFIVEIEKSINITRQTLDVLVEFAGQQLG